MTAARVRVIGPEGGSGLAGWFCVVYAAWALRRCQRMKKGG